MEQKISIGTSEGGLEMKLGFGFCLQGLICLILIMLPNLFWFILPPANPVSESSVQPIIGIIQSVTRIAFFAFTIILVNEKAVSYKSPYTIFMVILLMLYYITWIRYFAGGRDTSLLTDKLWIIPIPLAIFPVLFFLLEALWLGNIPALIAILLFGIFHCYEAYMG
jgi:hypothetical protein